MCIRDRGGGGGGGAEAVLRIPLSVAVVPTPPRRRRLLFDMYHSSNYPHGFFPNDDLTHSGLVESTGRPGPLQPHRPMRPPGGSRSPRNAAGAAGARACGLRRSPRTAPRRRASLHACDAPVSIRQSSAELMDWNGDHPHTNYRPLFLALRAAGFYVEVCRWPPI